MNDPLLDFTNKVVLITGAAQGFGSLLAQSLAERGAKLVLGDINEAGVNQVAAQLVADGHNAIALGCDVSKRGDCKALADAAIQTFDRIDIAVNNAGVAQELMPLHLVDEALMDRQFNINVKGVQFGMSLQLEQMIKQGGGTILNVSSRAGLGGAPTLSAYSAAKHAVIGLTKSAAVEYARYNVRINAICPSFALTPMVTNMADDSMQDTMSRHIPMKRLAQPQEIVSMMLMMLSPSNTYMTGQCISVDGGASAI